jgi:hypothetical protein
MAGDGLDRCCPLLVRLNGGLMDGRARGRRLRPPRFAAFHRVVFGPDTSKTSGNQMGLGDSDSARDLPECEKSLADTSLMAGLSEGPPTERIWIIWHALIGFGVGTLFIPQAGPPIGFIVAFLVTAMSVMLGVQIRRPRTIVYGFIGLGFTQVARAAVIWKADTLGAGSRLVATFVWLMLAVGAFMEAYAVRKRGIR